MDNSNFNFDTIFDFFFNKLKTHGISIIFSVLVLIFSLIAIKISKRAINKAFIKINKQNSLPNVIAIKSTKILILLTAFFLILSTFKISISAIFTLFSSSLVAVGLALKDFFCSVAKSAQIRLMRPFAIGDLIEIDSKKGRVKKIDYMHTYITNEEHGLVMVPNALIADKSIINYSRREKAQKEEKQN